MTAAATLRPSAAPPVAPPPATATWDDLCGELDAWATAGRTAGLWWRDDDAVAPTPALERLRALADRHGVPLALAVIPERAEAGLADAGGGAAILQHGWSHANHAAANAKKTELVATRLDRTLAELAAGRDRLAHLFGDRALPVLVPPWNRIAADVAARLPALELRGLSTFGSRRLGIPGVAEANTHIDPVHWHGGGGFAGDRPSLAAAVAHLRARRSGAVPEEPTGLLTHHLVMDDATWSFMDCFFTETKKHSAVRWLDATTVFAAGAA